MNPLWLLAGLQIGKGLRENRHLLYKPYRGLQRQIRGVVDKYRLQEEYEGWLAAIPVTDAVVCPRTNSRLVCDCPTVMCGGVRGR